MQEERKKNIFESAPRSITPSVLLIIAFGAAVRLFSISKNSLWLDEATTLSVATHPLKEILAGDAFNNHTPPFYYLAMHFWLTIAPHNELGLRTFSLLADVLNIGIIYWIFSIQFSKRVGMITATLYAISPFAIYYAQEARMYPLVTLLGLLTYCCALQFVRSLRPGIWQWILCITAITGSYTHYYYIFFVLSLSIALFAALIKHTFSLRAYLYWLSPLVLAGICFLPWLGTVLHLAAGPGQTFRHFILTVPPYAFFRFVAGYAVMPITFGSKDNLSVTLLAWLPIILPYALVFGFLFVWGLRRVWGSSEAYLLFGALFGPPIISLLLAVKINIVSERYWSLCYPYFLCVLGLLPWGSVRPLMGCIGRLCAAALWLVALSLYYFSPSFGFADWRTASSIASRSPNPLVFIYPDFNEEVFQFYYQHHSQVLQIPESGVTADMLRSLIHNAAITAEQKIVLVESGNAQSMVSVFQELNLHVTQSLLLPFENGIRVVTFDQPSKDQEVQATE
jgi:uncharacterized membrane protein